MLLRPIARVALILAVVTTAPSCDLVRRYVSESPADRLVEAALAEWAAPGGRFLEGVAGQDTVASVSPTGARSWEVAVIPPSGGVPVVWSLEIPLVEVYPTFPGEAFASWLQERARALGMRTFLPPEVAADLRSGAISAVGNMEIRYGPADRSGRNTQRRTAYLAPTSTGRLEWRIRPESRSVQVLTEALDLVAEDMLHRDERVLTCMGSASPTNVPRHVQLACLGEVLEQQFGQS